MQVEQAGIDRDVEHLERGVEVTGVRRGLDAHLRDERAAARIDLLRIDEAPQLGARVGIVIVEEQAQHRADRIGRERGHAAGLEPVLELAEAGQVALPPHVAHARHRPVATFGSELALESDIVVPAAFEHHGAPDIPAHHARAGGDAERLVETRERDVDEAGLEQQPAEVLVRLGEVRRARDRGAELNSRLGRVAGVERDVRRGDVRIGELRRELERALGKLAGARSEVVDVSPRKNAMRTCAIARFAASRGSSGASRCACSSSSIARGVSRRLSWSM